MSDPVVMNSKSKTNNSSSEKKCVPFRGIKTIGTILSKSKNTSKHLLLTNNQSLANRLNKKKIESRKLRDEVARLKGVISQYRRYINHLTQQREKMQSAFDNLFTTFPSVCAKTSAALASAQKDIEIMRKTYANIDLSDFTKEDGENLSYLENTSLLASIKQNKGKGPLLGKSRNKVVNMVRPMKCGYVVGNPVVSLRRLRRAPLVSVNSGPLRVLAEETEEDSDEEREEERAESNSADEPAETIPTPSGLPSPSSPEPASTHTSNSNSPETNTPANGAMARNRVRSALPRLQASSARTPRSPEELTEEDSICRSRPVPKSKQRKSLSVTTARKSSTPNPQRSNKNTPTSDRKTSTASKSSERRVNKTAAVSRRTFTISQDQQMQLMTPCRVLMQDIQGIEGRSSTVRPQSPFARVLSPMMPVVMLDRITTRKKPKLEPISDTEKSPIFKTESLPRTEEVSSSTISSGNLVVKVNQSVSEENIKPTSNAASAEIHTDDTDNSIDSVDMPLSFIRFVTVRKLPLEADHKLSPTANEKSSKKIDAECSPEKKSQNDSDDSSSSNFEEENPPENLFEKSPENVTEKHNESLTKNNLKFNDAIFSSCDEESPNNHGKTRSSNKAKSIDPESSLEKENSPKFTSKTRPSTEKSKTNSPDEKIFKVTEKTMPLNRKSKSVLETSDDSDDGSENKEQLEKKKYKDDEDPDYFPDCETENTKKHVEYEPDTKPKKRNVKDFRPMPLSKKVKLEQQQKVSSQQVKRTRKQSQSIDSSDEEVNVKKVAFENRYPENVVPVGNLMKENAKNRKEQVSDRSSSGEDVAPAPRVNSLKVLSHQDSSQDSNDSFTSNVSSCLSPEERRVYMKQFLDRVKSEDPLEGTSKKFEPKKQPSNVVKTPSKKSMRLHTKKIAYTESPPTPNKIHGDIDESWRPEKKTKPKPLSRKGVSKKK